MISSLVSSSGERGSSVSNREESTSNLEESLSFLALAADFAILVLMEQLGVAEGDNLGADLGVLAVGTFAKYLSMTLATSIREGLSQVWGNVEECINFVLPSVHFFGE